MSNTTLVYTGTHYGIEVKMCQMGDKKTEYGSVERKAEDIIEAFNKNAESLELLPICCLRSKLLCTSAPIDVFKYIINGNEKYCIISECDGLYFLTEQLPADCDMEGLILDVKDQYENKSEPEKIPSKFAKLIKEYEQKTRQFLSERNDSSYVIEERNRIERNLRSAIKKEPEKFTSTTDYYEDEEDMIEEYMFSRTLAYLLDEDNYSYSYLEFIAKLDHHDILAWEVYLRELKRDYTEQHLTF